MAVFTDLRSTGGTFTSVYSCDYRGFRTGVAGRTIRMQINAYLGSSIFMAIPAGVGRCRYGQVIMVTGDIRCNQTMIFDRIGSKVAALAINCCTASAGGDRCGYRTVATIVAGRTVRMKSQTLFGCDSIMTACAVGRGIELVMR